MIGVTARMAMPVYPPTTVLEIVSFGYRKLFEHLWPITKLSLPFILFASLTGGFFYADMIQASEAETLSPQQAIGSIAYGLGLLPLVYLLYALIRYARDVFCEDSVQANPYAYLMPNKTLLGLLGIWLLFVVAMFPIMLLMVLGFILLILPGIAVVVGLVIAAVRMTMVWYTYLLTPEQGIIEAFRQSWRLTKDNFWRTLGLGLLLGLIQWVINLPFSLLHGMLGLVNTFNPAILTSPVFPMVAAVFLAMSYWAQLILGTGAVFFVHFRYLFDLKARHEPPGNGFSPSPSPYYQNPS